MGAKGAVFSLKIQASKAVTVGYEHQQYFYFLMALLIPAIVVLGFSTTINQNLSPPGLCDSQFGVQRADQMLPDQVIKNEGNGSGERKNVSDESWNGKIQQAGCEHSERS